MEDINNIPIKSESIKDLKKSLSSLKQKMLKLLSMCESQSGEFNQEEASEILNEGIIDIIGIKHSNYKIVSEFEDANKICNNEQKKAEEKNLHYQNLLYQNQNLLQQIKEYDSFQTPQVNKLYGDKEITTEILEEEIKIRKEKTDKLNILTKEKEESLKSYNDICDIYKNIQESISKIGASTMEAQQILNPKIEEEKEKEEEINEEKEIEEGSKKE
ncbi:MAG: hypothetical protein MJ252_17595, partial [archaeon]|nr:hypothetical protein [archaeon]